MEIERRRDTVRKEVERLQQFAQTESMHHDRAASFWRWVDVVLTLASGLLAGIGGVLGIARATVGASPGASATAQHASTIDPVVAGLIAVSATLVTTAATALGASRLTADHRVAASGYLRLSNSAGDFVVDLDDMVAARMETGLAKLRTDRDKVTEQTGKLPSSRSRRFLGQWFPRWFRRSRSLAE